MRLNKKTTNQTKIEEIRRKGKKKKKEKENPNIHPKADYHIFDNQKISEL